MEQKVLELNLIPFLFPKGVNHMKNLISWKNTDFSLKLENELNKLVLM